MYMQVNVPYRTSTKHYVITTPARKHMSKAVARRSKKTLSTIASADEFVEFFCEKLQLLFPHSFLATQQVSFYKECKSTLKPGELLVQADFSENYAFIVQDAAQGFHRNNSQATIHPLAIYYKELGEEHISAML